MKSYVSYEKQMHERAIQDHKGLFTLDVINAGEKPGKFGGRITMQCPADAKEYKVVRDFMLKLMESRSKKQSKARKTAK